MQNRRRFGGRVGGLARRDRFGGHQAARATGFQKMGEREEQLGGRRRGWRGRLEPAVGGDRKSTRLNSSHGYISYAVFCLKKKNKKTRAHLSKKPPPSSHSHQPLG